MSHLLALDQGTTSSRAIVFRRDGTIAGVGQCELQQHFPRPGWVEHDPLEIWSSQRATIAEALAAAELRPTDIVGLGITNQRETTIIWDRLSGAPVHNAIVWQDRRTAAHCDRLRADGLEPLFRGRTGLLLDPYFSGTKVAWLLDNVDGLRARAERGELAFGTVDSWLVYRLSGGALHITDASNASRTLLYDIHAGEWSDELLAALDVPRSLMPDVRLSSEVYGTVAPDLDLGEMPIAGIVGDQQAATLGQLCVEPGLAKNTYGTGCFLLMNIGSEGETSADRLLTTVGWQRPGDLTYCLEGAVFVGGATVQWLRDGLGLIPSADAIEPLARSVADSAGVVLVPALAGLGAPHWDPYARGLLIGMTRGTTAAHVARAALDGIAFQVTDLLAAMTASAPRPLAELRVDGGAAKNDLLLQIQADLLQRPVVRPTVLETTALGAAYMAGLAIGVYDSFADIATNWHEDRRFEPSIPATDAESQLARWRDAVERCKDWEPRD